jgi:ribonuclease P protein component
VGSAVVRNRAKRLLREAWREVLDKVPAGHDYVLAARPGFAEPAETRGREWLVDEISDVLGRVRP